MLPMCDAVCSVFGKLVKADSLPGVGDRKESLVGGKVSDEQRDMHTSTSQFNLLNYLS